MDTSRCAALITGAGSSSRMGTGRKKEYELMGGVPVISHCIRIFQSISVFSPILLTIPAGDTDRVWELISPHVHVKNLQLVAGGKTRRESVLLGLCALKEHHPDYILIHDAARPWISAELIEAILAGTKEHGACIPVLESRDALVEVDAQGFVSRHLDKASLRSVQTPQGFRFPEILAAHEKAKDDPRDFYDDAQVLIASGKPVYTIPGNAQNRKITYAADLEGL